MSSQQAPLSEVDHLLSCVSEECAEVAKEASKCLRFGLNASAPRDPTQTMNATRLVREYYELKCVVETMQENGMLPLEDELQVKVDKLCRLNFHMQIARDRGRLMERVTGDAGRCRSPVSSGACMSDFATRRPLAATGVPVVTCEVCQGRGSIDLPEEPDGCVACSGSGVTVVGGNDTSDDLLLEDD